MGWNEQEVRAAARKCAACWLEEDLISAARPNVFENAEREDILRDELGLLIRALREGRVFLRDRGAGDTKQPTRPRAESGHAARRGGPR